VKADKVAGAQPGDQAEEIEQAAPEATLPPTRDFATKIKQHGGLGSLKGMFTKLRKG